MGEPTFKPFTTLKYFLRHAIPWERASTSAASFLYFINLYLSYCPNSLGRPLHGNLLVAT